MSSHRLVHGHLDKHLQPDDIVDMTQGFDTTYIYTGVVESRIVGDSLAPLLRDLPVSGSHGAKVSVRFTYIQYVPLLYAHFKSIEINIRDDTGRLVPFEYGAGPDCSEYKLQRVLCSSGGWCTALLRQCPVPAGSRSRQSVRTAMPLIKRGDVALGKGALKTGVRIADDVLYEYSSSTSKNQWVKYRVQR